MRVVCQSWLRWHHSIACWEDKARNETAIWATGRRMRATSIKLLASSSPFLSLSILLRSPPANILNMFVTSNSTVLDSFYHMISDSSAIKLVFLYILHQIWKKQQYLVMPLILRKLGENKVELSRHLFPLGQIIKVLFRLCCASWLIQLLNTINFIYFYPLTDGFWKKKKAKPNIIKVSSRLILPGVVLRAQVTRQQVSWPHSLPPSLSTLQNKLQGKTYKEAMTE